MNKLEKLNKLINKKYKDIKVNSKDDIAFLSGEVNDYDTKVNIGFIAAKSKLFTHIVNEIKVKGLKDIPTRVPSIKDKTLDKKKVDVLVIGGGITGCAILRELSKYNLSTLLIDKEEDVAMHASSRNDGNVHVGVDLKHDSKKLMYLKRSQKVYEEMCKDLDVEFLRTGQGIALTSRKLILPVKLYLKLKIKKNGLDNIEFCNKKKIHEYEPNLADNVCYGVMFHNAGEVNPYGLTIALAESSIINGAKVSLNTYAKKINVKNNHIESVETNRGTIYPKVVINAAGTFAEDIAIMANDHFYSIHPRKGLDVIIDKKKFKYLSRASVSVLHLGSAGGKSHSKGGGVVQTVDQNTLVGPDAIEQPYKEDFSTDISSINKVMDKQVEVYKKLSKGDIITYFAGVRAATYEEDFIVEKGKWINNIVHAAGIQSPGITCAPAIAEDVAKYTIEELGNNVAKKDNWIKTRKGIVNTRKLSDIERDKLIQKNPDYGLIVCRCEEISKGEIIDAIHSVLPATTIDGIKRRVRAGMGRCQGGFCQEHIVEILAKENKLKLEDICKKGDGHILVGDIKGDLK